MDIIQCNVHSNTLMEVGSVATETFWIWWAWIVYAHLYVMRSVRHRFIASFAFLLSFGRYTQREIRFRKHPAILWFPNEKLYADEWIKSRISALGLSEARDDAHCNDKYYKSISIIEFRWCEMRIDPNPILCRQSAPRKSYLALITIFLLGANSQMVNIHASINSRISRTNSAFRCVLCIVVKRWCLRIAFACWLMWNKVIGSNVL